MEKIDGKTVENNLIFPRVINEFAFCINYNFKTQNFVVEILKV